MKIGIKQVTVAALTGISLVFSPFSAKANSDWTLMSYTETGKTLLDRASITRSGAIAKASMLFIYSQASKSGVVAYSTVTEFSCIDKKMRDIQTTYLKEDRSVIKDHTIDKWEVTEPGSIGERIVDEACANQ